MPVNGTSSVSKITSTFAKTAIPEEDLAPVPASAAQPRGLSVTFRSLRHRNYRLYFFGQLVSLLGSWIQFAALSWLTYKLTDKSWWIGLINAAQILPTFLLGAWGGTLADRLPKRLVIFWTQSAFTILAFFLAALVLTGHATPWNLLAIALATGVVQAIDLPARLAFVMDMVGREDLTNAVGLNSVLFNLARTVGPALSGYMLLLLGAGHCFLVNAISYLPLLGALLAMNVSGRTAHPHRERPTVAAGFQYLAGQPQLAYLVLLGGIVSFSGWPFLSLLPAFATHVLGMEVDGYTLLLSATGCGALAAALVVASFGSPGRQRVFIAAAVGLMSLALVALSLTTTLVWAFLWCAAIGFGLILFFATTQSAVQLAASAHNRGLVMGIWAMILSGAQPVGNLIGGAAGDRWGEVSVLQAEGIVGAVSVFCVYLLFRFLPRRSTDG